MTELSVSPRARHALCLRIVFHKPYSEIAAELGVSYERARQLATVGARRIAWMKSDPDYHAAIRFREMADQKARSRA